MSYVLVGILFLLIAAGFIAYLVMTATRRSSPARESGPPGIGTDDTPLGDTAQHSPAPSETTGTTRPDGPAEPGRFQRDPVGGEGEGAPYAPTERT